MMCRYWQGELFSTWAPSEAAISVYSRTFAQSVAGTPTQMTYDPDSAQFDLCFNIDTSISAPTEISANFNVHYTKGVEVTVSGSAAPFVTIDVSDAFNMIYVSYTPSSAIEEKLKSNDICVRVTKKV